MVDRLSIIRNMSKEKDPYTELLFRSFDRALALDRTLSDATMMMQGMSGRHYRFFINNLVGEFPDPRYLEVGSWRGSTACSVMDGNAVKLLCIDNWCQFGGPKDEFNKNTGARLTERVEFRFIEDDFRRVDFADVGTFNIYLFDGPHDLQDQIDGLTMALPALESQFVFIVDDWNFDDVREGTFEAIASNDLDVISSIEVRTTQNNMHSTALCEDSDWHNGYFLAVLRKQGGERSVSSSLSRRYLRKTIRRLIG